MKVLNHRYEKDSSIMIITKNKTTKTVYFIIHILAAVVLVIWLAIQTGTTEDKLVFYVALLVFMTISTLGYLKQIFHPMSLALNSFNKTLTINEKRIIRFSEINSLIVQFKNQLDSDRVILRFKFASGDIFEVVESDSRNSKHIKTIASKMSSFCKCQLEVRGDSVFY